MGLLDDAIREHLELKRRRGADPTEVEREEREVLGPVAQRAAGARADELEFDDSQPDEHEPLADSWANGGSEHTARGPSAAATFDHEQFAEPAASPDVRRERESEPYAATPPEPQSAAPLEPAPFRDAAPEPPPYAATPAEPAPYPIAPAPPAPYPATPPEPAPFSTAPNPPAPYATAPGPPAPYRDEAHEPPNADQETAEYSLEEASPEQEGEPDDVLEETPEFLQDTPDHDRLWFEQRPPRDFDFDG